MAFRLLFYPNALAELSRLRLDAGLRGRCKAVNKALGRLEVDPKHPGLHTHKLNGETCPHGDSVWQAYAENDRPSAYRIKFCYPPKVPDEINVIDIVQHD